MFSFGKQIGEPGTGNVGEKKILKEKWKPPFS